MKPKQILKLEDYWGIEIEENRYEVNSENRLIKLFLLNQNLQDLSPLQELNDLELLYLSDSLIEDLNCLKGLKRLITLYLLKNNISNLTPLQELKELKALYLRTNNITDFSPLINLKKLRGLSLSDNQIDDLSPLRELNQLIYLNLESNQIDDLSPLKELNQLTFLSLESNQIDDLLPLKNLIKNGLKIDFSETLIHKNIIKLYNNPLPVPLINAIQRGNQAVLDYLDNLEKEEQKGTRPLNEAKMVIIGEPDAGKTTLMNYLLGKPFTETKTTQGIRMEPWEIADESGTPYRINIWDFGGQEIQSTVHKFFLTQETLYVVVLNARKDEQPDKYL